eukprot:4538424-Prymnesium_polylepis.1
MWLADVALAPTLPVGWMRRSTADGGYYWNALCGMAQWEHPAVSLVAGVAEAIRTMSAAQMARAAMEKANAA